MLKDAAALLKYKCGSFVFVAQWLIHATVDHLKANLHKINLWHDQLTHIAQVLILWALYVFVF